MSSGKARGAETTTTSSILEAGEWTRADFLLQKACQRWPLNTGCGADGVNSTLHPCLCGRWLLVPLRFVGTDTLALQCTHLSSYSSGDSLGGNQGVSGALFLCGGSRGEVVCEVFLLTELFHIPELFSVCQQALASQGPQTLLPLFAIKTL